MKTNKHNPFTNQSKLTSSSNSSTTHTPTKILKTLKEKAGEQLTIKRLFFPDIPIDKHYINLSVIGREQFQAQVNELANQTQTTHKERPELCDIYNEIFGVSKDTISIKKIVSIPEKDKEPISNRILITGTAGVGKSTLSEYLLYLWAKEKYPYNHYQWVFRIPIRYLRKEYYPFKENEYYTPIDIIERTCLAPLLYKNFESFFTESERSEFSTELERLVESNKVLIILDGYDEINQGFPQYLTKSIKSLCAINQIIITSRPYNLESLRDTYEFRENSGKHFEITGFTPDNINNYVQKFFKNLPIPKPDEISKVIEFIQQNPNIAGTCRIPINLELICTVWSNNHISNNSYTMSSLYNRVLLDLCIRHKEINTEKKISNLDQFDLLTEYNKHTGFLEHFAYQTLLKNRLFSEISDSKSYLKEIFPDYNENFITQQNSFGFIKTNNLSGERRGSEEYYFGHLTLRDYFAARYLAHCLQQKVREISKREIKLFSYFPHQWQNSEIKSIDTFIQQTKFDGNYEIIFWFIAGILAEAQDIMTLKYFFNLLIQKPYDLCNIYIINLLIRTLDESQSLHSKLPEDLFKLINNWLTLTINPDKYLFLNLKINPLWERLKLSRFAFRHSLIQKVFTSAFNGNEIDFKKTCKALETIQQPLPNSSLSCILEKESFSESVLKEVPKLLTKKLIEQDQLADTFKNSKSLIKKRINAIQILVQIDYFGSNKISELMALMSNNQEAFELRITATNALIASLTRGWNFMLKSKLPRDILENQNFDNAFKLLINLIQNNKNPLKFRIATLNALEKILNDNLANILLYSFAGDAEKLDFFLKDQNIDQVFKLLISLVQSSQNLYELHIAVSKVLCSVFSSIWNSALRGYKNACTDVILDLDTECVLMKNQNLINACKALVFLIQNFQTHIEICITAINAFSAILNFFGEANEWRELEYQSLNNVLNFLASLILDPKTPCEVCIATINAASGVFLLEFNLLEFNPKLHNQNIQKIFKILISLIQNSQTLPILRITAINAFSNALLKTSANTVLIMLENPTINNIFISLSTLTQNNGILLELRIAAISAIISAIDSGSKKFASRMTGYNHQNIKAILKNQTLSNAFKSLVDLIQNTHCPLELRMFTIKVIFSFIISEESLKIQLEYKIFDTAFNLLIDLIQNIETPLELRIFTTNALCNALSTRIAALSSSNHAWSGFLSRDGVLKSILENQNLAQTFKLLTSLVQNTEATPKLHIAVIDSIGKIFLDELYNFESCEKFVISYFFISTKQDKYNIYQLITLNIPNGQKEISQLIQNLRLNPKLSELDFNLEPRAIINPSALSALLENTTQSEFVEKILQLPREKSSIRVALLSVLFIRCIENGKALYIQNQTLFYYENQSYHSVTLTSEQQSDLIRESQTALKNLTKLDSLHYHPNLSKQLSILPSKNINTDNQGEMSMTKTKRSEVDKRFQLSNDQAIVSVVRRPDYQGHDQHVFIIIERLLNESTAETIFIDFVMSGSARLGGSVSDGRIRISLPITGRLDEKLLYRCTLNLLQINDNEKPLSYSWQISNQQLEDMIARITEEQKNPPPYLLVGRTNKSQQTGEASGSQVRHNCLTWALEKINQIETDDEKLEIPTNLQTSLESWIVANPRSFLPDKRNPNSFWNCSNVSVALTVAVAATAVVTASVMRYMNS